MDDDDIYDSILDPDSTVILSPQEVLEDILVEYAEVVSKIKQSDAQNAEAIMLLASDMTEDFEDLVLSGKQPRHPEEMVRLLSKRSDYVSQICLTKIQEGHN